MLTEKKKKITKCEIWTFLKKKKNGLRIQWLSSFPLNLAWIHAAVSEKHELTGDGRTTDARATTAESSSADSQAEPKTDFFKIQNKKDR